MLPNSTNTLKTTDILLINKEKNQPIGYVKKLSIHFEVDSILVTADWQIYNPPLPTKKFKGVVSSIKWSNEMSTYLTVELSNIQEIRDETTQ